jgi:3-hydroxy acid dehydrogenase/malonic semialdehyde reductase
MIVLVTGASSGFGAAIPAGERVLPLALDVRDGDAVRAAIEGLPSEYAEIDVLVNNAGLAKGLEPAHQADLADWDQMLDTNCRGLVHCTRAVLPGMVARGQGHVVNIGSVAATHAYPGGNVYGATKAFVHQFSRNLRSDLHGTGVRVTCVEPGMCEGTEFSLVRFDGDAGRADAVYEGLQALTAEDIAETVHWATNQPPHVNVNIIELMPVAQSPGPFQVHRGVDG